MKTRSQKKHAVDNSEHGITMLCLCASTVAASVHIMMILQQCALREAEAVVQQADRQHR